MAVKSLAAPGADCEPAPERHRGLAVAALGLAANLQANLLPLGPVSSLVPGECVGDLVEERVDDGITAVDGDEVDRKLDALLAESAEAEAALLAVERETPVIEAVLCEEALSKISDVPGCERWFGHSRRLAPQGPGGAIDRRIVAAVPPFNLL